MDFLKLALFFFSIPGISMNTQDFMGMESGKVSVFVAHFYCYYAQGLCSACRSTRRTAVWMCCDEGWFPAFPTGAPVEKMKGGLAPPKKIHVILPSKDV